MKKIVRALGQGVPDDCGSTVGVHVAGGTSVEECGAHVLLLDGGQPLVGIDIPPTALLAGAGRLEPGVTDPLPPVGRDMVPPGKVIVIVGP